MLRGSPINARGTERIEPTKSSFHCAKEVRCAKNIGLEDYFQGFQSDFFRSVDAFRGAPGMISEVEEFISLATVVLKLILAPKEGRQKSTFIAQKNSDGQEDGRRFFSTIIVEGFSGAPKMADGRRWARNAHWVGQIL